MICQIKTIKTCTAKASTKENVFTAPDRTVPVEQLFLGPYTSGPFVVPVSRWVE